MDYASFSPEELIVACLRTGQESAWVEFIRRFHPLIAGVVVRMARRWGETSREVVDDLVQETYLKLCADGALLLERFRPEHPDAIFGYVKVLTANVVHDHFKSVRSAKRGGRATMESGAETVEKSVSTSRGDVSSIERGVLVEEIDTCLRAAESGSNSERDRRIFWLYYRTGLTASAIAGIPSVGLTTKGVESTLLRLTRQVKLKLIGPSGVGSRRDLREKGIPSPESL